MEESEGLSERSEGQPEGFKGPSEGSEGQPEGFEGWSEGSVGQIEETLGNTKWSDGQPEGQRISQWGMGASLGDLSCWMDMEFLRSLWSFYPATL